MGGRTLSTGGKTTSHINIIHKILVDPEKVNFSEFASSVARKILQSSPVAFPQMPVLFFCGISTGVAMGESKPEPKLDLLQGTLDLMVLQTLATMGALHGYGIARRIEQVSGDQILLNQGTIYASLVRLQQRGWIAAEWGTSDNNRKAKYYSITRNGRKQLAKDAAYWQRLSNAMDRVLTMPSEADL
jgi:PadR family transcriptional regulator, regulatory protein PadR